MVIDYLTVIKLSTIPHRETYTQTLHEPKLLLISYQFLSYSKISPQFYQTPPEKNHYSVNNGTPSVSILSQINPVLLAHIFKIHFNIFLPPTHRFLQIVSFIQISPSSSCICLPSIVSHPPSISLSI